ncbi:MAG TPA: hypothetical protein VGO16_05635 [Pseudonocardiaceae bacterium]|nr:hypothetical protein [Pseudonocardiaceae bacterium]
MTVELAAMAAVLLVCLGLLLGGTWTIQAVQPKLRRQAEERRRLNEEWSAVRTARRQRGECPLCSRLLSERDWYYYYYYYYAPTIVEDPPDDN